MAIRKRSTQQRSRTRRQVARTGGGRLKAAILVVAAGALFGIGWNALRDNGIYAPAPAESFESTTETVGKPGLEKGGADDRAGRAATVPSSDSRTRNRTAVPRSEASSAERQGAAPGGAPRPVSASPSPSPVATPPAPAPAPAPKPPAVTVRVIELLEARTMAAQGTAIFVDARSANNFLLGHIPRALNVPNGDFDAGYAKVKHLLPLSAQLVVYCTSADCDEAELVIARLLPLGYQRVLHFKGGWADWENARLPQETGPGAGGR